MSVRSGAHEDLPTKARTLLLLVAHVALLLASTFTMVHHQLSYIHTQERQEAAPARCQHVPSQAIHDRRDPIQVQPPNTAG
ncbi:hypothetical protein Ait01nite_030740 [Actinoplanes italicus]|nr:hypothetical protein Ait01nite_030740 [Actinoplanes italicus]